MSQKSLTQAVANVVQELDGFSSEDRHRIVAASMTLLGESPVRPLPEGRADEPNLGQDEQFPAKARNWMQQHGLTVEQIHQVFHFGDDGAAIIAHIPGTNRKEQVRNAYVLCGISRLLTNGETRFEDKIARSICESNGFYDGSNHMKYMKRRDSSPVPLKPSPFLAIP
jgi:hypothetical protein